MPPKSSLDHVDADVEGQAYSKSGSSKSYQMVLANAGKVHLEPAEMWGKGIIKEMKSTVGTHWLSEMINFNTKTIPVALLVFISVIAPTLAFGASYGKVTNNAVGAIETMLATAWVGVVYSLIGGMPICILGSTGPVLALSAAIVTMAKSFDVPYLTFNVWISVWMLGYTLVGCFFDLTRYIKLATRFTDEIFALLIVSIFVLDAIGDPFSDDGILRYLSASHPSHEVHADDEEYSYLATGFLSALFGLGTTWLIFFLRDFKKSTFFCNQAVRNLVHDFAVTGSVVLWTVVKHAVFPSVKTETLNVPDTFEPTFSCCDSSCKTYFPTDCEGQAERYGSRPWMVDFGDLNGKNWIPIFAAVPAILGFLLTYLDSGITWHLINHPSHKITHGEAYNYDLILNNIFNLINAMMGLPWLVATTVPCLTHLHALAERDKDGKIVHVLETRLTHFLSHLMVGLSILFLTALKFIPRPVLKGVFLFMGLASLPGIQFWNRVLNFIRQPSLYPDTPYTRFVNSKKVHLFTVIQIFFFFAVFAVQNFPKIAIAFPFMILMIIPGRMLLLPNFFTGWELTLLDGSDEEIEEVMQAKEEEAGGAPMVSGHTSDAKAYDTTHRTHDVDEAHA